MTLRTRLIILGICALAFIIFTPYIILYSLGYRVDFENFTIVTTGGIYVKPWPTGTSITIDNTIKNTTGNFYTDIFVQNLLPKNHSVLIQKDGYYDYQKNLLVKEKQVTKLEDVILFKKDLAFELAKDTLVFTTLQTAPTPNFVIKNTILYAINDTTSSPIIKNVIAFTVNNNRINWLSGDGFLYNSDLQGNDAQFSSSEKMVIAKKTVYQIIFASQNTFLKAGSALLWLNPATKIFQPWSDSIITTAISPNNQQVLMCSAHKIIISLQDQGTFTKTLLKNTGETISDCQWLNDHYVMYATEKSIGILETDARGNINEVFLPNKITADGITTELKNPKIFFNPQDKKVHILIGKTLLISEQLVP